MKANKMAALQSALKAKPEAPAVPIAPPPARQPSPAAASTSYMAPSRAGKTNITAYLSQDYKRNLRLIQAKTGRSLQTLIAESLNDLFQKHDVPVIDHE
jgi:hypothetical protein